MSELLNLASDVATTARTLGADEVSVSMARGSHTTLTYRDGKLEQASEAATQGLSISLMVDERSSGHSTSDLRPTALKRFIEEAIAATRWLEKDPARALPESEACGRGISQDALEQLDPEWQDISPDQRNEFARSMYGSLMDHHAEDVASVAAWYADGMAESARVMSNGFADTNKGAWFTVGGDMTLMEGEGRRPQGSSFYASRYLNDLPDYASIADEVNQRARERLGSGPISSGKYPLILANRSAGRILGTLGGPLNGASIFEGRSCLAGKRGQKIGSSVFTIIDDPTIPRGLGSRPWDGDALVATPRTVVENGVLKNYYINTYYGRKLKEERTSGSRSNWVIPHGDQSWQSIAANLPKAILVTGFLGGNANGITGDFSYGITGQLLEYGTPTKALSEMNVTGNVLTIFDQLSAVGNDPWTWSAIRSPTLVFDDIQFSGL